MDKRNDGLARHSRGTLMDYPKLYTLWKHKKSETIYLVIRIVNENTTNEDKYPVSVVYVDTETEMVWCRPLSRWFSSMERITTCK